jgi:hypothetical protein
MSDDKPRASGKSTSEEVTRDQAAELDQPIDPQLPDERKRRFNTPGMSRIRMEWLPEQQLAINRMHKAIDDRLANEYGDAFGLMFELYRVIREPIMRNGEPILDSQGLPQWKVSPTGQYVEDWGKLNMKQRERFLYQITTRLFVWEQRATEAWAESMYAKVEWEMSFSTGYDQPGEGTKDTIEGRTARGKLAARDDHFLAIFRTYYSRKAEALVRSLERISQRLKDVHMANGGR